jgi:hypothetical protein
LEALDRNSKGRNVNHVFTVQSCLGEEELFEGICQRGKPGALGVSETTSEIAFFTKRKAHKTSGDMEFLLSYIMT